MRHFKIVYNNKTYEFDAEEIGAVENVERKEEVVYKAPKEEAPVVINNDNSESKDIKSPISGKVIDILVNVGDSVKEGDDIVLLDSMKMELSIQSEFSGKIESIKIKKGDLIEMDQVVMTIK